MFQKEVLNYLSFRVRVFLNFQYWVKMYFVVECVCVHQLGWEGWVGGTSFAPPPPSVFNPLHWFYTFWWLYIFSVIIPASFFNFLTVWNIVKALLVVQRWRTNQISALSLNYQFSPLNYWPALLISNAQSSYSDDTLSYIYMYNTHISCLGLSLESKNWVNTWQECFKATANKFQTWQKNPQQISGLF